MQDMLEIAMIAAEEAGGEIMNVYDSNETINYQEKSDQSPLTIADKKSNEIIMHHLSKTGLNILSEENDSINYNERKEWGKFWLVDPLDGTKEFIKKNGEFTVNIALIEDGSPKMGIVYCPVTKVLYWNEYEGKVYKKENFTVNEIKKRTSVNDNDKNLRVVVSRSHINDETNEYIEKLNEPKLISCGSSLKFLYIADNKADIYPGLVQQWNGIQLQHILFYHLLT